LVAKEIATEDSKSDNEPKVSVEPRPLIPEKPGAGGGGSHIIP